jgi:hypothetical protein
VRSRSADRPATCRFVTFYSYKGGIGRSQAVANVAWILASSRKRTLLIDWDLEAPGVYRYFSPFLDDPELSKTSGLIEFFIAYTDAFTAQTLAPPKKKLRAGDELADLGSYAVGVDYPFPEPGVLHLVPAGRQDSLYADRVRSFDWRALYARFNGGAFIDRIKAALARKYDYVLIDSRTGVSDTAGICTVQLPDDLVICFTPNNQSIRGGAGVAASVRAATAPARPRIFPLFARKDPFEKEKLERRWAMAKAEFAPFPDHLNESDRDTYWDRIGVPHVPYYSYEEVLAVFGDQPGRTDTMLAATERLTEALTDGDVSGLLSPPTSEERSRALAAYAGRPPAAAPPPAVPAATPRYDAYLSYNSQEVAEVSELYQRLQTAGVTVFFDRLSLLPGVNWQQQSDKAIRESAVLLTVIGRSGVSAGPQREYEVRSSLFPDAPRIIPVLLPSARSAALPKWVQEIVYVRFEHSLDEPEEFGRLVEAIRGSHATRDRRLECPYRGSRPYTEAEADLFFGRGSLVAQILKVVGAPIPRQEGHEAIILSGPPGVGTTSLARAGVLGQLQQGKVIDSAAWPIITCTPGADPLEGLAEATVRGMGLSAEPARMRDLLRDLESNESALHLFLRTATGRRRSNSPEIPDPPRVVVFVDQAHEAFLLCRDLRRREGFFRNIAYAARATAVRTTLLLAVRASFLEQLQSFFPSVRAETVAAPAETDLREMIERPAAVADLQLESGLTELLLGDVARQPGGLPFLQATLKRLWEARSGRRLTVAAYQKLGGIRGVASALAEGTFAQLSFDQKQVARRLLVRLARSPAGQLRLATPTPSTVPARSGDSSGQEAPSGSATPSGSAVSPVEEEEQVIQALTDARLLTTTPDGGAIVFAHDSLVTSWQPLQEWVEEDRRLRAADSSAEPLPALGGDVIRAVSRPPLALIVLWHPRWQQGAELANQLYAAFGADEGGLGRGGIGVPVFFRSAGCEGTSVPAAPPLDAAEQVAALILASIHLSVDRDWRDYLRQIAREVEAAQGRHLWLVASFTTEWRLSLDSMNEFRPPLPSAPGDEEATADRLVSLCSRILLRLLRKGESDPARRALRLFLSHAVQDGRQVAQALRDHARSDWPEGEIVPDLPSDASDPTAWLRNAIGDSVFLAVRSDNYASRAWCRFEARTAKAARVPMIAVHALQQGEDRSPTYLGNVPSVRWTGLNADEILDLTARETLRCWVAASRFRQLRRTGNVSPAAVFLVRPPEPLDATSERTRDGLSSGPRLLVYPDPAVDEEELRSLRDLAGAASAFVTLTGDDRHPFLVGRRVGLSAATPAAGELGPLGLGPQHFQDTMTAVARRLLGHGADLSHGGDLRAVGLGAVVVDLARGQVPSSGRLPRVINYLAWPIYLDVNTQGQGTALDIVTLQPVPPPSELVSELPLDPTVPLPADNPENRARHRSIRARCLSAMRQELVGGIDALVLMGGKVTGFLGLYPGVIEEVLLALERRVPIYILGGWGGCARALAAALWGDTPPELTEEFQLRDPALAADFDEYRSKPPGAPWGVEPVNYASILSRLHESGMAGLRNGLSPEENIRLTKTIDRDEAVFLVAKGLRTVGRPEGASAIGPGAKPRPAKRRGRGANPRRRIG